MFVAAVVLSCVLSLESTIVVCVVMHDICHTMYGKMFLRIDLGLCEIRLCIVHVVSKIR